MATRALLRDLVARFQSSSPLTVTLESVGGVDASARVVAGEAFDAVILAADAIDALIAKERVVPGSRVDLVHSEVAIAVRAGAPHPDVRTEDAVKRAVLDARSIGYSTGPSGTYLIQLFERWNIGREVQSRLVKATPGIPVGSLVASGEVELGFQQLSELANVAGIDVLGTLPDPVRHVTTFSGGIVRASTRPDEAQALLAFMASDAVADVKRQHGMEPA